MAHTGRDRAKADRLRRKGERASVAERDWLARYDAASARASTRVVVETDSAADASSAARDDAAGLALAEAAIERERGNRTDRVLDATLRLLALLVDAHQRVESTLIDRLTAAERSQLEALAQFRDATVARARAEARLIEAHVEHRAAERDRDSPLDDLAAGALQRFLPAPPAPAAPKPTG